MKRARVIMAIVAVLGIGILCFHPSRPLTTRSRDLEVVADDGVRLSATLSRPRWRAEPLGAVVLVHGSGPLTREHVRGDARSLVALGFVVLAYDKRGCGESGGEYRRGTADSMVVLIDELANDARAALTTLRAQPDLAGVPVGFFGASQAGWIISLASSRLVPLPDFNIILSGPTVSTGVEGYYSELTGDGSSTPRVADAAERERLTLAFSDAPGFDPLPLWLGLHVPTLWLLGVRDLSVPTFASKAKLEELARAGHDEHTVILFPNAGHDLRDVDTGESAQVWNEIEAWWTRRSRSD